MQTIESRRAAIAGTRMMIAEIQFAAFAAMLVDCGAIPRPVMAATLRKISQRMKHSDEWQIDRAEVEDRSAKLLDLAAAFENRAVP